MHKQHKSKRNCKSSWTASKQRRKVSKCLANKLKTGKIVPQVMKNKCFQFLNLSSDYSKIVQQRQLLDGQLNENKSVLEELTKLSDDKNTVI